MAKRELIYANDMDVLLSDYKISIEAINQFLIPYSAKAQYRSAIYDLLGTETLDVRKLTIEHYKRHVPENPKEFNTQQRYKHRFFQFLFAMDYLENSDGFDSDLLMHKAKLVKEFTRDKKSKSNDTFKDYEKSLTTKELIMVQNIIDSNSTKHETLKMQFCWYAIFELGLPIDEVRKNITSDNYVDGMIETSLGKLPIPQKFHQMFYDLSQREYNGFAILDTYIENLGVYAKLERKLLPSMIKLARTNHLIKCGNCFETYTNETNNWVSVNNKLVCVSCADEIKKKLDFEVKTSLVDNTNYRVNAETDTDLSTLFTFDDLKQKLINKPVDYLKLHEIQIEIGKLGEAYVYENEVRKLAGTKYLSMIDEKKALDPSNGYDILSYTLEGNPIHIEVKATSGNEDIFFLSNHEYQTARNMRNNNLDYVIYFVKSILSQEPKIEFIHDIIDNNDYYKEECNWKIIKKG